MVGLLLRLRWLAAVVAFFSALHAVAFVAIGVMRGLEGYRMILSGPPWPGDHTPGVELARSIDAFLLAMVFFVFSVGVTVLFLVRPGSPVLQTIPEWMRVRELAELKFLVWEAILAAMVVASVESFVGTHDALGWTSLVLPIATLILAAGLALVRKPR